MKVNSRIYGIYYFMDSELRSISWKLLEVSECLNPMISLYDIHYMKNI